MDLILDLSFLFCVTLLPLAQGNVHGGIKSKSDSFNCSLSSNSATAKLVQRYFQEDKHVIRVNLTIDGQSSTLENINTAGLLDINKWTFAKDENGQSLLLLDKQFELMSLYTLSPSVSEINALVQQYPENCFGNLTEREMETAIRLYFLNLIDYTKESSEIVQICNKHFYEVGKTEVEIMYECCSKISNEQLNCKTVQPGKWYKIFKICTYVLIVIAWGFVINLIPTTLLEKSKRVVRPYRAENVYTDEHETFPKPSFLFDSRLHLNHANYNDLCLDINIHKLCSPDRATAGFSKWLWNSFAMCDIKDFNEDTKMCCTQNMLCAYCWNGFVWYRCLRVIVYLITIAITTSPLLFRFHVHFKGLTYIPDTIDYRNLTLKVRWNNDIANYSEFSTFVVIYEIINYVILVLYSFLPGKKKLLRSVFLECMEKEIQLREILTQCFRCLILQCKLPEKTCTISCKCKQKQLTFQVNQFKCGRKFSLHHVILLPFSFLLTLVYFCLVMFPTSRFIRNFVCKIKQTQDNTVRCSLLGFGLFIVYTVIFFADTISFLVQCAVYFMAGIIFNYDANLKYIGTFIFICLYWHEVITNTNDTFEKFKDTILKSVQACHTNLKTIKTNGKHNDIFYKRFIESQSNFKADETRLYSNGGLVFYIECHGKYIAVVSDRLLNKLASLKIHPSCPGSLSVLYIQAIGKIITRALLLVIVLFMVLALSNDFSASIKTLFAFSSGLIVTNIRKFLSTSNKRSYDDDIKFWQNKLMIKENTNDNFLKCFEESWTICSQKHWSKYKTDRENVFNMSDSDSEDDADSEEIFISDEMV